MNCTKCDNVFKCNGEIHDNCHINDEGLVCPDCVEMGKCDCEYCEDEDEDEEESKYCEFCNCDNLMKPNFEHFVKGFGWCSFCCKKQFEKQTYYNEEEDMYYFNGDY